MEISIILYAVLKLYLILNIYQQSHYHIKAYFKHFILNFVFYDLIPLVLLILGIVLDYVFIQVICSIYLICFGILYVFTRLHLNVTKRIIYLEGEISAQTATEFTKQFIYLIMNFQACPISAYFDCATQ